MDAQTKSRRTLIVVALIGIVASMIMLIMWMKATSQITDIEQDLATAEARIAELEDAAEEPQAVEPDEPSDLEQVDETTEPPSSDSEAASVNETSYSLVTDLISTGSGYKIKLDYVQFLTGEDATDAAIAAGEEPLDFYVLNQNPKIRNFPVADDVELTLLTGTDGLVMDGFTVSMATWKGMLDGTAPTPAHYDGLLYVVEIENGEVTKVEEQYLP